MKTIQVRISDQEEAALRERMALTGLSISGLVRASLFPETGAQAAQLPASSGQVNELAKEVAALAKAVDLLAAARENGALAGPVAGVAGGPPGAETEREPGPPGADFAELTRLLQEQTSRPFGLDLPFVQATFMAVFTLARGSFSHYPEEWQPFKDEALRRAFAAQEEGACPERC
jgi:hypothetical protein